MHMQFMHKYLHVRVGGDSDRYSVTKINAKYDLN